jgi:hypothetical protein
LVVIRELEKFFSSNLGASVLEEIEWGFCVLVVLGAVKA